MKYLKKYYVTGEIKDKKMLIHTLERYLCIYNNTLFIYNNNYNAYILYKYII